MAQTRHVTSLEDTAPAPELDDTVLAGEDSAAGKAKDLTPLESARTLDVSSESPHAKYPEKIGRFEVKRKLGEGGMGVVLEGFDPELARPVAIKLLRTSADSPVARARLLREAQALAKVADPHVVPIYDVGLCGSDVFIAMELVAGGTLAEWIEAAPHPYREVLARFVGAGRGLRAVHAAGIGHRDINPENVLLGLDGRPRVADFGLARAADASAPPASRRGPEDQAAVGLALTRDGTMMGTPVYMSPEHFEGHAISEASDQFSFAVALYRALFRRAPFAGETLTELSESVLGGKLIPPDVSDVPPAVVAATLRALSRNPEERWPTLAPFLDALEAPLVQNPDHDPSVARKTRVTALATIFLLDFGAMAFARYSGVVLGPTYVLVQGLVGLGLIVIMWLLFRKDLTTTHNRRLMALFLCAGTSISARRVLALASTGSVIDGLRDESIGLAALVVLGGYMTEPWLAAAAAPFLVFAVASTAYPHLSPVWYGATINVVLLTAMVFWARQERASRRDAELATQPTRSTHSARSSGDKLQAPRA